MSELPDDYGTPQYDARWMREKMNLPAESPTRDMQGAMHRICHEAHGYDAYVKSYKCNDKQGEIARLTVALATAVDEAKRLTKEREYFKSQSIQLAAFACRLQHSGDDVPEDVIAEARALVKKWKLKSPTTEGEA